MPLISNPTQVKDIYDEATERGIILANFCTANQRTTEAIFLATHLFGQRYGIDDLPVVVSATANYPIEPQLQQYTATGNAKVGLRALLADVDTFLSSDSPYGDIRAMLHLDHALPGVEDEIIPLCLDRFATIMYDCSYYPFDDNIQMVARFVEQHRDRVLVEGAVDEVIQSEYASTTEGHLTDPAQAERFLYETGAFLIVPNLGTEHRATAAVAAYDGALAQAIRQRVGPRMVLHGSSSLQDEDLPRLADDGIIKVNVWSIFERLGGQALARDVLLNLGNIFPAEQLQAWQAEGYLGQRFLEDRYVQEQAGGALGPKGANLVELRRRTKWHDAVVARMMFYLEQFGYQRWE
jgi:fructose-bisphosphate aldolase class II